MVVRRAAAGDLAAIESLWHAFEREDPSPPYQDIELGNQASRLRARIDDGLAFVAEQDGTIVGFAIGRARGPRYGELTDLYVREEVRRRGLAAALAAAIVDALAHRGAEHIELDVTAANAHARAVYQRWGFHEQAVTLVASVKHLQRRLRTQQSHPQTERE